MREMKLYLPGICSAILGVFATGCTAPQPARGEEKKPSKTVKATLALEKDMGGWFPFAPKPETFAANSGFDLRNLNEKFAGENGFISVKNGHFVHSKTGESVRFWAVNGPPDIKDRAELTRFGRLMAKYGVNMARIHGGYFDESGEVKPAAVQHAIDITESLKSSGVYSHFSIYFPLWITPKADNRFVKGYDGKKYPFATLYFNKTFQKQYREWWKALLTTSGATSGKRLVDEPAVASVELVNEDSYFFWTFSEANLPEPQLKMIEGQFGAWATKKYGSASAALTKWNVGLPHDSAAENRLAFRPLYSIFSEKNLRDRDTVQFLLESQRTFYSETIAYLRELGFKGMITCSNWYTASPEVLGPLEKYSYTVGDFIDRHGYFSCFEKGESAEWSMREKHTYADRSALRFDPEEPGKPKLFINPVMDPHYQNKPSMISETTFTRPNRYRSEAPLYFAAYGALQNSDAFVHFALDGATWGVKPGYFMQPWTLMSPAMVGQFPAAALLFRKGLVSEGDLLAEIHLKIGDILALKGTPLPQDAALDELRLKDVPVGNEIKPGNIIDPLIHFAGQTRVDFSVAGGTSKISDLSRLIDRKAQTIISSHKQLKLDYGAGTLLINAPGAQGISGDLAKLGKVELADLSVSSEMSLGHMIAVSLDGKPLSTSTKILLQVMSEEKNSGFETEPAENGLKRIVSLGQDPWSVKSLTGSIGFKRSDAKSLKVTALDHSGYPVSVIAGGAAMIRLRPTTLYYLIEKPAN